MCKKNKFYLLVVIFIVFSFNIIGKITNNYREKMKIAFKVHSLAESRKSLSFCNAGLKKFPDNLFLNYLAARLNALLGNNDRSMLFLKKATNLGYTTKLPFNRIHHLNDQAFDKLRNKKEFKNIMKSLDKFEKPVHKSQIAFVIKDKKLGTEGITYDPLEKMFYLGSITKQKIVKVDCSGKSVDFTKEKQDGLNIVLGIHIDPVRRHLWACSVEENGTGVFKYDLTTGKFIKKYLLKSGSIKHAFNDLVIHPNGDIFISDPPGSAVYKIPSIDDRLELYLKDDYFLSLNGITLSQDGEYIYVADYATGIYKINIKSKNFIMLSHDTSFTSCAIDGLYFKNNKLYAVQVGLNQVSRFTLDSNATHIKKCEIFEKYTPDLIAPTTGVIVDDHFYYVTDDEGKGIRKKGVVVFKTCIK